MRREKTIDLGIRNLRADIGDHIAYFWETEEEFDEAVSFLEKGMRDGDHVVVFGHQEANEAVLEALGAGGHDWRALVAEGRLSVLGPEPSGDLMLSRIGATFQNAVSAGASLIRLLGNIGWGRPGWPDEGDILRFESRVTGAAAAFPCIVMCMYDIKAATGSVLLHGAFGTHPLTIHQNLVRENPMCVPVEEYLARIEEQRGAPAD